MRKEHGGMEFHHLYDFNLVMLGKHSWKFIFNQDAIVTRVFKAKYFSKVDFLQSSLGHNPSFTWRSIYSSRVVVKQGLRWCIGNVNNINIWKDPWFRGSDRAFLFKVNHLMDWRTCVFVNL